MSTIRADLQFGFGSQPTVLVIWPVAFSFSQSSSTCDSVSLSGKQLGGVEDSSVLSVAV
jgi:hypothetical protein